MGRPSEAAVPDYGYGRDRDGPHLLAEPELVQSSFAVGCLMSIITDFKSIRQKLERQEQKAEFEEKNPPAMTVVWTPEWGYGGLSPSDVNAMARAYMACLRYVGEPLPEPEFEWSEDKLDQHG